MGFDADEEEEPSSEPDEKVVKKKMSLMRRWSQRRMSLMRKWSRRKGRLAGCSAIINQRAVNPNELSLHESRMRIETHGWAMRALYPLKLALSQPRGRKVADVWKKDVWEFQARSGSFRFLPSFPSFPRENRSSKNVWENAWKSQTSFLQTSVAF